MTVVSFTAGSATFQASTPGVMRTVLRVTFEGEATPRSCWPS
jgi:hypothetical protein